MWRRVIDKALRGPKEQVLAPIVACWMQDVHPNWLSLAGFGIGVAAAGAVWQHAYGWGAAPWIANRVVDGLDGTAARVHGEQSELCGYLDIRLDALIYALIPSSIVLGMPLQAGWLRLLFLLIS